ncbi:hypothetical protein N7533_012169 [Penicillium manginii]|uniref:uncharacterized protein n=1 Tax=Penicillium manginii TaxID=203109 RepID=UPI002546CB8F|nr:uncharacterized protein N7533_012169 [Penicillium manginii]KAJ5739385.1 hypothetical protein N7533_012169 [Penicillium manginii]
MPQSSHTSTTSSDWQAPPATIKDRQSLGASRFIKLADKPRSYDASADTNSRPVALWPPHPACLHRAPKLFGSVDDERSKD